MKKIFFILLVFTIFLSSCNLPTNQPKLGSEPLGAQPIAEQISLQEASPLEIDLRAVAIVKPANGETYTFLATVPVLVSAISSSPIVKQELLVNDTVTQTQTGDEIDPYMNWLANTPGANRLQIRMESEDGQIALSETVEINVDAQAVGFDILQPTVGGETLVSLAEPFGATPEQILANNPGLATGANDPLPAGLLIRIPIEPYVPGSVLAQIAPGVVNLDLTGGSASGDASAPTPVGIPPFTPPSAPGFNLKAPPSFEKVYYYLSLNSSPWSRVPRLPEDFITPANGFFNLEEALQGTVSAPAEGTLHAEVDAWGWSGGTLVYIGRFERIFSAEPGREPFFVTPGELEICLGVSPSCAQGFSDFVEAAIAHDATRRELRWIPPAGATGGLWQVSRLPFSETCSPDPAGVFQSGGVNVNASEVYFNLDFPAPGADSYSIPLPMPGGDTSNLQSAWLPQPYYVRILPMFGDNVTCVASNQVVLTMDPSKPPEISVGITPLPASPVPPVLFDIEIVEFKPIHFPDGTFQKCVIVTQNPFYENKSNFVDGWLGGPYYVNDTVMLIQNIPPGTMLCPQKYVYKEPPFLEKVGTFIKDAINIISEVYEVLKGLAVQLVVKAIPYCYASEFVDAYKDEIDSVCNAAAKVIVEAAMAYVGLPPSIPNYEQLQDTAKGKITDLAVEQLEAQTGLPCYEFCKEFIRDQIDEVWAAGENLLSNHQPACKDQKVANLEGFEPLCLPSIVKTSPVPESILQPAQVQVRLTRRPDASNATLPNELLFKTACALTVSNSAENNSYVGKSIFLEQNFQTGELEYWNGTTLYANSIFKSEKLNVSINDLAPGDSKDYHFALAPNSGTFPPEGGSSFWLPGKLQIYRNYFNANWKPVGFYASDDWEYYYLGAQLTLTASATCTTSPNSLQELQPSTSSSSDVWVEQIQSDK